MSSYGRRKDGGPLNYVSQVYGVAFIGLLVSAYAANVHLNNVDSKRASSTWLVAGDHATWIQVGCFFLMGSSQLFKSRGFSFWKFAVFLVCAFAAGLNVGSWILMALQEAGLCRGSGWSWLPDFDGLSSYLPAAWAKCTIHNPLVKDAFLLTAGLYLALTLASLGGGRGWRRALGGAVGAGLWILFGSQLLSWLGWISASTFALVYIKGGLVVYSFKVLYDTEGMAAAAESGEGGDVINDAVRTLFNFLHMFIRIIALMGKAAKAGSKKRRD